MTRRKAVSKKIRFEVFKRDSFTCQYCGRKAPDVVLHVDHIKPVKGGGGNTLLNLTTSCVDCNAGKGARELSDGSVVAQQRAQLEGLQERQEQIQMMIDWQRSLVDLDAHAVDAAADFWLALVERGHVTPHGKETLRKLVRRHGLEDLLEAMRVSVNYFRYDDDGRVTSESIEHAFTKLGGICTLRKADAENPHLKDVFYIRGVIRNRFSYVNLPQAKEALEHAFAVGGVRSELYEIATGARNWTQWADEMDSYINSLLPPVPVKED
jgi:hypothetical protein